MILSAILDLMVVAVGVHLGWRLNDMWRIHKRRQLANNADYTAYTNDELEPVQVTTQDTNRRTQDLP